MEKIEKLTLIDIEHFGQYENPNKTAYRLKLPNLKIIEFLGKITLVNFKYLNSCKNLETIVYDSDGLKYYNVISLEFYEDNLKNIICIKDNKKYDIKLEYKPYNYHLKSKNYEDIIMYNNNDVITNIKIENDILKQSHSLIELNDYHISDKKIYLDNGLFIPDYITNINLKGCHLQEDYKYISINLNLLKTQDKKTNLFDNYDIKKLKKIELRNNNEMSLFKNFEIEITNDIKELYIEKNILNIVYPNKIILIDENGKKTIKEYVVKNNNKEEIEELFNKYNLDEIEEFLYYKKLLEILKKYKDDEINAAMNLVGDKIIKKLTK